MFSPGKPSLDPDLFAEGRMHAHVRKQLLEHFHKNIGYNNPSAWAEVHLAGSGASYQWQEGPHADLDMLVSVDYPEFRAHNANLRGLTDNEIAWVLNSHMRKNLNQDNWWDRYEMTWYNNPEPDIRKMNPYAAYSLTKDVWHVQPTLQAPPSFDPNAFGDTTKAQEILDRYTRARTALERRDLRPELRKAHASSLSAAMAQGHALFESIHNNRKAAFGPGGHGYNDPANVRWQTAKASGVVPALRVLSEQHRKGISEQAMAQYGMAFPDVKELVIRAMMYQDER
jgi:hypothetical protein